MDETTRWVIGAVLFGQTGIVAWLANALWRHVNDCRQVREQLGGIAVDIRRIKEDIGDHEHGIRGWLHEQAGALTRHELDIERLKK